jgi:predicted LppA-like lipoprotein
MNRRCWLVSVAMIAAVTLSACHYNPYRYPRPGEAEATTLENQLKERDSLQDAAKDMIAVGAAIRDAVQRVYPDAVWAPTSDGVQGNCAPPYVFLSGTVYVLPRWQSRAPTARPDVQAIITAVANVLKAHHADKVDTNKVDPAHGPALGEPQSLSGVLPREHGELRFVISAPVTREEGPTMALSGTTGCHHAKPGPGPWDTPPPRPEPPPGNGPPEPPPGNGPGPPAPPP